jgi:hypothetical protein
VGQSAVKRTALHLHDHGVHNLKDCNFYLRSFECLFPENVYLQILENICFLTVVGINVTVFYQNNDSLIFLQTAIMG